MPNRIVLYQNGGRSSLKGTVTGQVPTWNQTSAEWAAGVIPYDVAGSIGGAPPVATTCFTFKAARAFTLKGTGHVAHCEVQPSGGNPSLTLKLNGSNIGTINFTAGSNVGSVTITSGIDTEIAVGDRIVVETGLDMYSMQSPYWTLLGTCP